MSKFNFWILNFFIVKLIHGFFILITLIVTNPLNGQQAEENGLATLQKHGDLDKKLDSLNLLLKGEDTLSDSTQLGRIYHELGKAHFEVNEFGQSEFFFLNALAVREKLGGLRFASLIDSKYALSELYKTQGEYDKQRKLLEQIIEVDLLNDITCDAYVNLAKIVGKGGDPFGALNYLNIALTNEVFTKNIANEIKIRHMIIMVYAWKYNSEIGQLHREEDLKIINTHLSFIENWIDQSGLSSDYLVKSYNNAGNIFGLFNKDLVLENYIRVRNYYRNKKDTYNELEALSNMAFTYFELDMNAEGEKYSREIIKRADDIEQIATAYGNWAYFKSDSNVDRVSLMEKAISIYLRRSIKDSENEFVLPDVETILNNNMESDMIIYLVDLSIIYADAFFESDDKKYLLKSKEAVLAVDDLVSAMRQKSPNEASKLYWAYSVADTYGLGARVCCLLDDWEGAFYCMEKSKAILLQENILSFQNKLKNKIPNSILEREYALRYDISSIQKKINSSTDLSVVGEFKERLEEHSILIDSLSDVYPEYMKSRDDVQITTLALTSEKYISEDRCLIEFILSNDQGVGIFSSVEDTFAFELNDVDQLQQELQKFRQYLKEPLLDKSKIQHFREVGKSIFEKLFPFEEAISKLEGKHLIVVPDQNLINIPFEAFPIIDNQELSKSYLVNQTEVSYMPSFSVIEQIAKKEHAARKNMLGVAPSQFDYADLPALSDSEVLKEMISEYSASELLAKHNATKKRFLDEVGEYRIVHISTHGGVGITSQEPWLAFNDEKLMLSELFGVENNADLVIIDACKSNEGEYFSGEGVINLSRGFFYNGTKSIISSLWNINQRAGDKLMRRFYSNLNDGATKSKALQMAKIEYLNSHRSHQILPYYWAVHTLSGDTKPINLTSSVGISKMWIWIALGTFILGNIFLIMKFRLG